jgi:phasin family protein
MASQVDPKADAAAEKAYAEAAGETSVKKAADAVEAPAPAPAKKAEPAKKIDAAVKTGPAKRSLARTKKTKAAARPKNKAVRTAPKVTAKPVARTSKPAISNSKDKIMAQKTEKTTTDFTNSFKDAAGDLQARARAAYEKTQAYAGEMTEFGKGNLEALVESGKIIGAGMQDLARGEVEAAKGAFETVTADFKALAAVKSPTELFKLQGEIARRNFDAAVARFSKNAEVSMKLANEAFAPLSSRMSLAAEKLSKAA